MKNKLISLALALVLAIGIFASLPVTALAATANPTAATVLVNGSNVSFDAYHIEGANYFKLRDIAYTLNGTEKQFSVGWSEANNANTLTSGQPYVSVGGEMASKGAGSKNAEPTSSRIYLDGSEVQFTAYHIEGNNYFKLRDIGEAFDFGVDWDEAAATIRIDTSKGYTPEGATPPQTTTPPPSGGDAGLAVHDDYWYTGISSGFSYMNLVFYSNGEFEYKVHFYLSLTDYTGGLTGGVTMSDGIYIYNGTYSASNGILTLTYTSAQNGDEDSGMRTIEPPASHSVSYEILEDRYEEQDHWGRITEIRVYHELKLSVPLPPLSSMPDVIEELYEDGFTLYLYNENERGGSRLNVDDSNSGTFSWTGKWTSNSEYWGDFDFTQNGNTVTGTFSEGSISGTVSGNTLLFNWEDDQWRFTMSPEGNKFSLERYSSWGNTWQENTFFEASRVT